MREVPISEVRAGDAIVYRNRTYKVTDIGSAGSQTRIETADKGSIFLRPNEMVLLHVDGETLYCSECGSQTNHRVGTCYRCGEQWAPKSNAIPAPDPVNATAGSEPLTSSAVTAAQRGPTYVDSRRNFSVDGDSVIWAIGLIVGIIGGIQFLLAFQLWSMAPENYGSTFSIDNFAQVISVGIGLSGLALLGLGLALGRLAAQHD
jgi:hypothetical protein